MRQAISSPNGRRFSLHTGKWHDTRAGVTQEGVPEILMELTAQAQPQERSSELASWREAEICGRVLDVGCGTGWKVQCMNQWPGTQAIGCDMEHRVLAYGRQKLGLDTLVLSLGDALPFPSSHFDWVTASEVIEHLEDPHRFLNEAWRVLKPEGRLFLTTPNRLQYLRPWRPKLFWLGLQRRVVIDESHVREFSARELQKLLAPGFRTIGTRFLGTLWGWPRVMPIARIPGPLQRVWAQGIQMTATKVNG